VGSSANCAPNMTILNTIMAETLTSFKSEVDGLIEKGEKKEVAIMHVIKNYIKASKKVLFEGDGYSDEWQKEAAKRGLPNVKTTPPALDALVSKKAKELFEKHKVLTHAELEARHEIELEKYIKKVQIEGRVIGDLAGNHILPSAIRYQNVLIENITGLKEVGAKEAAYKVQLSVLNEISEHIAKVQTLSDEMTEARKKANNLTDSREKAIAYCDKVKPFFDDIRYHVDKLELLVDDASWELPKYRELLFLR
jgi:glutamine synthetase